MKAGIDTGNFAVVVTGDLKPEVQEQKLVEGVKYDLQRGGITPAWLALGGVAGENGKSKLPAEFKRNSIDYSDEAALTMQGAVEEWAKGIFTDGFTVEVTKYEGGEGEGSAMKRATEFVDQLLGGNKEALVAVLSMYDPKAADADRDGLIAIAHKAGVGKQTPKAKAPKADAS